jgi:hypothetical protein
MHRSYKLKSSGPSNGPPAMLPLSGQRSLTAKMLASAGVADEPCPTASGQLEHVAKRHERRRTIRALDRLGLTPADDVCQLRGRDVLHAPAVEFLRPLEGSVQLVLVRVGALQIGIAPRRARRRVLPRGRRFGRLRIGSGHRSAQPKEKNRELPRHFCERV